MIRKILAGKNDEAQKRLDTLLDSLGNNIRISWYPSAGNDYRDVLELHPKRIKRHGIEEAPNLFIHTDYNPNYVKLDGIAHEDKWTKVEIEKKYELKLTRHIDYSVNPEFVDFPRYALKEPTIYLLDILITSDELGKIKQPLIYFMFENINFFDEVILKNNIKIPYIVKVREGCGMGGNKKSISIAYAFLSVLNTRYLLIDDEEHTDFEIVNHLKRKHGLMPTDYKLQVLDSISSWSGFGVKIFSVTYENDNLTDNRFKEILKYIRESKDFCTNMPVTVRAIILGGK